MKALIMIFKILTFPIWAPLWIVWKMGKFLLVLVVVAAAAGCTTNSGKIDTSPCACEFTPFVIDHKESRNV